PLHRRAERLRQVDIAAHPRRPRSTDQRPPRYPSRRLGGAKRHGVPGFRPVSVDARRRQCRLRPLHPRRAGGRAGGPRRGRAQAGRPDQIPQSLSASALRRHAPARRHRARLRHRSGHALDGRAVRRPRCAEPRHPAGRAGAHLGGDRQDRGLHHPFHRGSVAARRPHRGDDLAAGPHQGDHRRAVCASAQPDGAVGERRVRPAQARHLAALGGRGQSRAGGARTMTEPSAKWRERLLYLISPIGLLLLWQILVGLGFGDRRFIPTPSDIAARFWQLTVSGELAVNVLATLWRVAAGFVIGVVPAIAVGLVMAMSRPVRIFFDPLIAALFPIPKVALMPLLLLAFGFGDASKIALVAIGVFFPVIVNTYAGAANIETIYWDVSRNYGASLWVMFTRIVFFGALPMIFAGLRIAVAVAFIVLVAAEFVSTKVGIGYMIWNSWELLQVDTMFVGIVVIGLLGLVTSALLAELERKVIPWKTGEH